MPRNTPGIAGSKWIGKIDLPFSITIHIHRWRKMFKAVIYSSGENLGFGMGYTEADAENEAWSKVCGY